MIMRSLCSDSRELAGLLGAKNFLSFSFATNTGSKSMNTSLKVSLLLRIAGHAISASAPDRVSISNSFLQFITNYCYCTIYC